MTEFKVTFNRMFNNLNNQASSKPYLESLIEAYSQKDRHYHDLHHITAGLEELSCFLSSLKLSYESSHCSGYDENNYSTWYYAVQFAWFYHDAIYSTGGIKNNKLIIVKDNEERSAELACKVAEEIGMTKKFIKDVKRLILSTKHNKQPQDFAGKTIIDLDLSILGQPKKIFDLYELNIRKEYLWVPEEIFKIERMKVLKSFLNRTNIYCTDYFRDKYEEQAKSNIQRSLSQY